MPQFQIEPKAPEKKRQVGLLLEPEVYEQLRQFAERNGVKVAVAGVEAVKFALRHAEDLTQHPE